MPSHLILTIFDSALTHRFHVALDFVLPRYPLTRNEKIAQSWILPGTDLDNKYREHRDPLRTRLAPGPTAATNRSTRQTAQT